MKYVELIIFDLDGTLVDSKEGIVKDINFTLREVGLKEKSASVIASYIGKGVDYLIRGCLGQGQEGLFEKAKKVFEDYRRRSPDDSPLYPGVKEVLEHFEDKKKAIVTNRKREFALPSLKKLGILNYFKDIIGEDDADCKKPSACPLDRIMGRFQTDKTKTIIVGDMDIDILSGKNACISTCGVTYGIGKKEDIVKAEPDFMIDNILELRNIIN